MNGPILRIAGGKTKLEFELEQGFSDGYTSNIRYAQGLLYLSHPNTLIWEGGEFKPLNIVFELAVGVQSIIQTPKDLVDRITDIYNLSLPTQAVGNIPPPVTTISVGSWFLRKGFIKEVNVDWKEPWDVQTGEPFRAQVRILHVVDFMIGSAIIDNTKLPSSGKWHFKFTGGQ